MVFRASRVTFFPAYLIELNTKNSARWQQSCHLVEFFAALPPGWVFGVQLGLWQTHLLIKTKTMRRGKVPSALLLFSSNLLNNSNIAGGIFLLLIDLVLICACVCRRPSWTPKNQPGASSAATWLSIWCSTRLLMPNKSKRRGPDHAIHSHISRVQHRQIWFFILLKAGVLLYPR